jgi:hypothetical protein
MQISWSWQAVLALLVKAAAVAALVDYSSSLLERLA